MNNDLKFQGPLCSLTILINAYFISTVYNESELQSLDYFLITLQCVVDLILSGAVSLYQYIINTTVAVLAFCSLSGIYLPPHLKDQ